MIKTLPAVAAATLLLLAVPAGRALAQATIAKPITTPDNQPLVRGRKAAEQPPSAVPGSRAEPALVAPAERVPTDMPPNEALFDAINRGDTVAAREAIGRGADIHSRNVLGMTPLEQSVDLGRSEISFLLLSLRGGEGYGTASGPGAGAPASPAEARAQSRAERQAAAREAARARREQLAASRAPVAAGSARTARLFAGDGGTPVPQAGFLGFDSAR